MVEYDPDRIKHVILNCGMGFTEHFLVGDIPYITYFSNPEDGFVELKVHERYEEEEIEEMYGLLGISVEQFNNLYRTAEES